MQTVCMQLQPLRGRLLSAYYARLCSAGTRGGTVAGLAHLFPNASKELKQEEISTNPYEPCPEQ